MRSITAATLAAACFLLCACSEGLYSVTAAGNGEVVLVNRMTGDARAIRGDTVVELTPPAATRAGLRNLTPRRIPNQPVLIYGTAKYRDGSMLVKIWVQPAKTAMSDEEKSGWRLHLLQLQDTATLRLQFIDGDNFEVVSEALPLNTMTHQVDDKGDLDALYTQLTVGVTPQNYEAMRDWMVGWNGFWPDYVPPRTESPVVPPKPKA